MNYQSSPVIKKLSRPVLTYRDIPYKAALIFNAGVTKFGGRYVMVFRNDYGSMDEHKLEGTNIGLAYSDDGINWKVEPKPCFVLRDDEIRRASEAAVRAGVTYVKTGTGWANKPTTVETVRLIKSTIGDAAKIKAAGGVRTLDTMLEMIEAGCDRFGIGLRSILSIMKEVDGRLGRQDDFAL